MCVASLPPGLGDIGPRIVLTIMHDTESSENLVPPAEFFRALELRRTQALVERDLATLEELHSPDYQLITPGGKVFSREEYLGAIRAAPFYARWLVGDMSFRISAQMVVVRYKANLRFPSGREVVCWHTAHTSGAPKAGKPSGLRPPEFHSPPTSLPGWPNH